MNLPNELIPTARLFGQLLIREVDREFLTELQQDEVAGALAEVGIQVPAGDATAVIEELAADYCASFVGPEGQVPLVQSLWVQGSYEGDPARRIRALAEEAGLEFNKHQARSAPVDHLGSILLLWADLREAWPEAARYLADHHLNWAMPPLQTLGQRPHFYGQLSLAIIDMLEAIQAEDAGAESPS